MDFLLPRSVRIVIECGGVQHYARPDGHAAPRRYADMPAEDRELRLHGCEVYRFGGAELVDRNLARQRFSTFFDRLTTRYGC